MEGLHFDSKLEFSDFCGMTSVLQAHSLTSVTRGLLTNPGKMYWMILFVLFNTEGNFNLSGSHKELLTWHWKLDIGMQII